jgi:formylglycine-generating enzyme required for sulfatase activity
VRWLLLLVVIAGGKAHLGAWHRDAETQPDERKRAVALRGFSIDRTEVTRADVAMCIAAGRCPPQFGVTIFDLFSSLPITNVSWREADAYCRTTGARLPTEDEWEYAARGSDGRTFPWGNDASCSRGNWGNYEGEGPCPANPGTLVDVGSYPSGATPEGVLDLAGNAWEWTANLFDGQKRGPEELGDALRRSVRGGGCCSVLAMPRSQNRVGFPEDYRDADLGFRCAK